MDRCALSDKLRTLSMYDFFRDAGPELQALVTDQAGEVRVPAGTVLFERGTRCGGVALIGAGSIRVFVANESGREMTLYHVGPGQTCPVNLLSALLDMSTPAKAIAESPISALMVPSAVFKRWVDEHAPVRRFVLEAMAKRLVDIMLHAEEVTFGRLDRRLVEFLSRRFRDSAVRPPEVHATHEQIAAELSTAREVVSRLLREFERFGAIDLGRGKITLKDPELMLKMCN